MKKVICIHLLNNYSGAPKVLSQVVKNLNMLGNGVSLFTSGSSEGFLTNSLKNHKTYFYVRYENKVLTLVSYFASQIFLFFRLLKYRNVNCIFYVNALMPFGGALAGYLLKKPVIYHLHETFLKPKILKTFLRGVVQLTASRVIYVSEFLKVQEEFEGIHSEVIYNSLPNLDFELAMKTEYKHYNSESNFNVLMISSLKEYKGVYEFISIANKFVNRDNISFEIILNANQNEIDNFLENFKISLNTKIYSTQTNVHEFYSRASLVLNLTRPNECKETFGLTILEAMAYGIPVIAPPVGGPSELIQDNYNGFQISCYEIEKITEKINILSKNENLCKSFSSNTRLKVLDISEEKFMNAIIFNLNSI